MWTGGGWEVRNRRNGVSKGKQHYVPKARSRSDRLGAEMGGWSLGRCRMSAFPGIPKVDSKEVVCRDWRRKEIIV